MTMRKMKLTTLMTQVIQTTPRSHHLKKRRKIRIYLQRSARQKPSLLFQQRKRSRRCHPMMREMALRISSSVI
jgi:hypothetical protein